MPLGDLAAGLVEIIFRFIGQFFLEIVFELLLKGPGYLLVKAFTGNKRAAPNEVLVLVVGIVFWLVIGCSAFALYFLLSAE